MMASYFIRVSTSILWSSGNERRHTNIDHEPCSKQDIDYVTECSLNVCKNVVPIKDILNLECSL